MFEAGRAAFSEGELDAGQEAAQNALAMYEQIYGPIHSFAATKSHSLGIMYQQLFSKLHRKVNYHDSVTELLAEMPEERRAENLVQLKENLLEDVEIVRAQADIYLELSIRTIRQAVVISERCSGLDDSETVEYYTDLALVEQMGNNPTTALRLIKYAIELYVTAYGPDHPVILRLLVRFFSFRSI